MIKSSERRMAENEVVFRRYNESIKAGFAELNRIAKEDNQDYMVDNSDEPLHFYCECSDENCMNRITLLPSIYNKIHENRNRFVVQCGHNTPAIEKIVKTEPNYCVVEKFETPNPHASRLRDTPIENL